MQDVQDNESDAALLSGFLTEFSVLNSFTHSTTLPPYESDIFLPNTSSAAPTLTTPLPENPLHQRKSSHYNPASNIYVHSNYSQPCYANQDASRTSGPDGKTLELTPNFQLGVISEPARLTEPTEHSSLYGRNNVQIVRPAFSIPSSQWDATAAQQRHREHAYHVPISHDMPAPDQTLWAYEQSSYFHPVPVTDAAIAVYPRNTTTSPTYLTRTYLGDDFHQSHPLISSVVPGPFASNASSATETFLEQTYQYAQGKASKRKKTIEKVAKCKGCELNVALLNVRGVKQVLESGIVATILCTACYEDSAFLQKDGSRRLSGDHPHAIADGKRSMALKRRRDRSMECEICKRQVAVGNIHGERDPYTELDVTIEVICPHCRERYGFCTECGGGGKYRTGKYRPKELFPRNRKTCLLSHLRIGNAALEYGVYMSQEVPSDQLSGYARVFQDAFLALYATPRVIQEVPTFATFGGLKTFLHEAWTEAIQEVLRPPAPSSPSVWYCATSWIPTQKKGKQNGRNYSASEDGADTGSSASLDKGLEKFSKEQAKIVETSVPSPRHCAESEQERSYAGLCVSEHNTSTSTVYISQLAVMQSVQSQGIARQMILRTLDRIGAANPSSTPRYVWFLTRTINYPMQRFAEKYGFVLKETFERMHPDCAGLFNRSGYNMAEYITYVARVEDLLSGAGGRI